jgi:pentatricopeptide repeat protein
MTFALAASTRDTSYDQTYVLLSMLVGVFALSKVYTVDYMQEVWIVALPMLAYLAGQSSAKARRQSISIQLKQSRQPELTLQLFDDMVGQGVEPDQVAFDRVARAHAQLGEVDRALQVREDATRRGLILGGSTYHAMIRACVAADRTADALDLFESMQEECIEPDMNAYYDAIRCYIKVERLETAVSLYKELAEASMPSCSTTCGHLSNACRKRGWTEMARKISADITRW